MKKNMLSMLAAMAATAAFAAANDVLITFSTPGPDRYADGKTVMDGECYALCWAKNFDAFSINPDGTATGGEVVLTAPKARDGRCTTVVFEINADYYERKGFADGKWAVYLLDTRRFTTDADGKLVVTLAGNSKTVNTSGMVGGAVSVGRAQDHGHPRIRGQCVRNSERRALSRLWSHGGRHAREGRYGCWRRDGGRDRRRGSYDRHARKGRRRILQGRAQVRPGNRSSGHKGI